MDERDGEEVNVGMAAAGNLGEVAATGESSGAAGELAASAGESGSMPDLTTAARPEATVLLPDSTMRELMRLSSVIQRRARPFDGVSRPTAVLVFLAGHENALAEGLATRRMTQVQIAEMLGIRPQSIGPMLQQLERDGLIERTPSATDKRAFELNLTAAGRERASEVREKQRMFAEEAFSILSEEEYRHFSAAVVKLNAALD